MVYSLVPPVERNFEPNGSQLYVVMSGHGYTHAGNSYAKGASIPYDAAAGTKYSNPRKTVPNRDAERKLFESIRLDKSGTEFDEYEIRYAINLALFTDTDPYERDGDEYVVKVKTPWGTTVHRCRMPITREIQEYREGVIRSRELRHSTEEQRYPPDVPVAFYDSIIVSVEGYSSQYNVPTGSTNGASHAFTGEELKAFLSKIPPHHKRQVAAEVSGALYDLDPEINPNA
jgi:hypothetical protein